MRPTGLSSISTAVHRREADRRVIERSCPSFTDSRASPFRCLCLARTIRVSLLRLSAPFRSPGFSAPFHFSLSSRGGGPAAHHAFPDIFPKTEVSYENCHTHDRHGTGCCG